jgi:hypothetical protein
MRQVWRATLVKANNLRTGISDWIDAKIPCLEDNGELEDALKTGNEAISV